MPPPSPPSPFFTTHHAPVGSWSSLTFGQLNRGMSIEHESLCSSPNADLLVALHRDGVTRALPFVEKPEQYRDWRFFDAASMTRSVSPCVDAIVADGISLRIFSPHAALPNPKRSGNLQYACYGIERSV